MVSGNPTSTSIPLVDGLSTDPPVLGRHIIKTVHKSSSYNSLILHVKSSFFYKKVSQSHSSAFFRLAVPDEGQSPIHNLHLKGGPTTG